jgi:hypothetical protein
MVQGTNAQGYISEYVYNGLGQRIAAVQTIQGANRANYGYRCCYNYAGYITDNGAYMSYAPVSVGAVVSTARGTNNYR